MNTNTTNTTASPESQPLGDFRVLLARVVWFILGPAMLLLMAVGIVQTGSGWATGYDPAFFVILAFVVFCRWFELRSGQGQDEEGHATNLAAFRPFLLRAVPIGLAVWGIANIVGNHLLT